MDIIYKKGIEGEKNMSNCPFWSNKRETVSCNSECPMMQLKEEEDCVFRIYSSSRTGISFKNMKFVDRYEYEEEQEEDYFLKRLKITSTY